MARKLRPYDDRTPPSQPFSDDDPWTWSYLSGGGQVPVVNRRPHAVELDEFPSLAKRKLISCRLNKAGLRPVNLGRDSRATATFIINFDNATDAVAAKLLLSED